MKKSRRSGNQNLPFHQISKESDAKFSSISREQAKVSNRERLEDLTELIAKTFSYLRAETAISADGEDFIRIVRKSLAGSRLRRAPTFYATIAKAGDVDDGGDVFTVELVLFNGRVVKSESIQ